MKKNEMIEKQIAKTFEQFDKAEKLPPNPFFYTRVKARIEENQNRRYVFTAVLKPVMLALLLAVNVGTAFWYLDDSEQQNNYSRSDLIKILSNDFNSNNNEIDLLNIQ